MGTPAAETAEIIARHKASAAPNPTGDEILVTADTVVVLDGEALGKPADEAEAFRMLRELSGRMHSVYTGVCLRTAKETLSFTERTDVFFRHLTNEEIHYYIEHYRPFDKAGAYGIQEWIGMVGVDRIEGCYYNVMGLPVARLYEHLCRLTGK